MKDKLTPVIHFMKKWSITIPQKEFENWRMVVPGTYTHKQLKLGAMREGITDGIHCHFVVSVQEVDVATSDGVKGKVRYLETKELMLANLNVELDKPPTYHTSKKKLDAKKANDPSIESKLNKRIQELYDELL